MRNVIAICAAISLAASPIASAAEPIRGNNAQPPPISQEEILAIVRAYPQTPTPPPPISHEEILEIVRSYPQPQTPSPAVDRAAQPQLVLNQQLDAIVRSDSQGWLSNRYDFGSMNGAYIRASSADGTTYIARGNYTYNGGTPGWIDVRIRNGSLECVEYFDSWFGCRAPNRPGGNSYAGVVVAGLVVAVLALAASGSSGSRGAAASRQGNDDDYGRGRRAPTSEGQGRDPTPRIGGEGGLYGCANPPCWDNPR